LNENWLKGRKKEKKRGTEVGLLVLLRNMAVLEEVSAEKETKEEIGLGLALRTDSC